MQILLQEFWTSFVSVAGYAGRYEDLLILEDIQFLVKNNMDHTFGDPLGVFEQDIRKTYLWRKREDGNFLKQLKGKAGLGTNETVAGEFDSFQKQLFDFKTPFIRTRLPM